MSCLPSAILLNGSAMVERKSCLDPVRTLDGPPCHDAERRRYEYKETTGEGRSNGLYRKKVRSLDGDGERSWVPYGTR